MKKGWQTKRLGEVCEIIKGRKPMVKATPSNGDLPYLVAKVMRGSAEAEYASISDRNSVTVEEAETIIICDGSNSGEVFTGFRGILSSTMGKIAKKAEIDDDFLRAFLASTFEVFNGAKTGAAIPHLDKEAMYQLQLPVPPLAEQQRIVGLLDEAFEGLATAKANAERNLQNARALFESHLQSVFTQRGLGWVEKPLGKVCDLQNGYAFKSGDYINSSNTLNIRMSSIRPGGSFDSEHNQRFLPDSYANEYAAFLLSEGDLIIAMTDMAGDPKILGVPTLVGSLDGRNFLMNQRVGKLFGFSADVRPPYLRYFLTSPSVKQFYKSKGAGGLQINISKGDILSVRIPLPDVANQDRVVEQLDALSEETQRLARLCARKLAALAALQKSLLHQAFTGEL